MSTHQKALLFELYLPWSRVNFHSQLSVHSDCFVSFINSITTISSTLVFNDLKSWSETFASHWCPFWSLPFVYIEASMV